MICMSKKLVSELLWDDDTWCSSRPVRESKEKVMQHSQLALVDCAQVVLEITEGEVSPPQGNGRMRKKFILSRVETSREHHKRGCLIPWNGASRKSKSNSGISQPQSTFPD